MRKYNSDYRLEFDIVDVRVLITMSGGFFDLRGKNAHKSSVHSHSSFEIHAVVEGEGVLETEHGSYTASGGEILVVPPGLVHKGFAVRDGIKTSFSFSFMKNRKRKESVFEHFTEVLTGLTDVVKPSSGRKYTDYLERIFYEYYRENICGEERLRSLFSLFITDLISDLGAECIEDEREEADVPRDSYNLIRSIMEEYVTVNFNKTPTLEELASAVHLGKRQAARVFRQCFGESFSEYVTRARLGMAKYLLSGTDRPISSIASDSGYSSYNGFYKLFKGKTGTSPEEYRNQFKEKKI